MVPILLSDWIVKVILNLSRRLQSPWTDHNETTNKLQHATAYATQDNKRDIYTTTRRKMLSLW